MFICSNTASPSMFHTFQLIQLVGWLVHSCHLWIEHMSNKKKMSWELHSKWKQTEMDRKKYQCTCNWNARSVCTVPSILAGNFFLYLYCSVLFFLFSSVLSACSQPKWIGKNRKKNQNEKKRNSYRSTNLHQESQEKQFSALHKQRRAKHVTLHAFALFSVLNGQRERTKLVL